MVKPPLFLDNVSGVLIHTAGLSCQNTLHLSVGHRQPGIPADLFFRFINAADHTEFQTSAGSRIGNTIIQPHQINSPAADVHEKNRRLILDEFRMQSNGGIALWEQFHILDGDFVGNSFKLEAHRLGRTQKVFSEGLFLPAKSGQRQPGGNAHRTLRFSTSLFDFLGDGCKSKQVVIVVFHFVTQDRLSAGSADIKLPAEFQCVLQGVGFMGILCNTGWERKMPGFDCVIAMVDANVHGFTHPFLLVVENLRFLLS